MKARVLSKGKYIGIVAPSNPIKEEDKENLKLSKKFLEDRGYVVKLGKNIEDLEWGFCANPKKRAEDINYFFKDPNCQMVWCARGGEDCYSILDFLDFDIISKNPKIFAGFSDITVLNSIIYDKTKLVTFSSCNFKNLIEDISSTNNALEMFEKNKELFSNEDFKVVSNGRAQGTIIGGNISLLTYMSSGKYMIDTKDAILFLEDTIYESNMYALNRNLNIMIQNGALDNVNAIVVGNYGNRQDSTLEDVLNKVLKMYNIHLPIIKTNSFGHIENIYPFPIGVKAEIDTSKDKKFKILEKALEE